MLGFGPSSNVSAIERGVFVRRSVGPNNCDPGYTEPHAAAPAAATGTQPSAIASAFMREFAASEKQILHPRSPRLGDRVPATSSRRNASFCSLGDRWKKFAREGIFACSG